MIKVATECASILLASKMWSCQPAIHNVKRCRTDLPVIRRDVLLRRDPSLQYTAADHCLVHYANRAESLQTDGHARRRAHPTALLARKQKPSRLRLQPISKTVVLRNTGCICCRKVHDDAALCTDCGRGSSAKSACSEQQQYVITATSAPWCPVTKALQLHLGDISRMLSR